MLKLDSAPLEIGVCTKAVPAPLSYWEDDTFPNQTYPYRFGSQDARCWNFNELDLARLEFADPLRASERFNITRALIRLDARVVWTLWHQRNTIPESWWAPWEVTLWHTKKKISSFCIDGLRLLNPHNVECMFYFARFDGNIRWGITPIDYNRGALFKALVLRA